jgi:hypothetical protein
MIDNTLLIKALFISWVGMDIMLAKGRGRGLGKVGPRLEGVF